MRSAYRIFVGKPERKRPRRWEDNSKSIVNGTGRDGMDWIHVSEDRVQGSGLRAALYTIVNILVP
jgi:hypothetical protein